MDLGEGLRGLDLWFGRRVLKGRLCFWAKVWLEG